ncbi:MAG: aldehyde dehydrogenase family protein, partial [Burkholderiales bacterium]
MATEKFQNYIAGEWTPGAGTSKDINPSDISDVVGEYAQADQKQTQAAIEAARIAFPAWANFNVQARADLLDRIGTQILARKDEFGTLLSREEGKTLPEGIGEVVRAGNIFKFFGGEVLRRIGELVPSVRPGIDVEIVREPLGVVGIISPWNFPAAIPAWKIAPALAYGNCVVFKPADLVPGMAHAIARIIADSGVPKGVFNYVMGRGSVVGEVLVGDPRVDAVTFTGSVDTGRKVAQKLVSRMAKFQLEMGGKNPLVVLDDADLKTAVECAVNGAFFSTGQRCTASSRLIVTKGIHDKFVSAM